MGLPYKIEVQEYCEGCPYFLPDVESVEYTSLSDDVPKVMHIIHCKNDLVCARVARIMNQVIE